MSGIPFFVFAVVAIVASVCAVAVYVGRRVTGVCGSC